MNEQPTSVIVVACNAFHLGFLGTYGNAWIETPNLDRLAAEGVVFDAHFAENLTTIPTRRSWWTGRYGFADPDQGWTPLRHDELILPDLLSTRAIRTALISDNPYLRTPGEGFGRGFDDVRWIRGSGYDAFAPESDPSDAAIAVRREPGLRLPEDPEAREIWTERWAQYLRNRNHLQLNQSAENTNIARTIAAAISWLQDRDANPSPFLLWIDLFAPHGPWDPPEPFRSMYADVDPSEFELDDDGALARAALQDARETAEEPARVLIDVTPGAVGEVISERELRRLRRTYAGVVSLLDQQLGLLFDAIRSSPLNENALVVFTADQGEPLGEHGYVRRLVPWLYDELIHTPLIIRCPKGAFGGTRHQALVQTVDLYPTILESLNVEPDPEKPPHGQSILPLIRGEKTKLRDYACMGMDVEEFAIRSQNWHLAVPVSRGPNADPDSTDESERQPELFRKPEDRWDQNNVADQFPEVADQLELALRRFAEASRQGDINALPPLRDIARLAGPA